MEPPDLCMLHNPKHAMAQVPYAGKIARTSPKLQRQSAEGPLRNQQGSNNTARTCMSPTPSLDLALVQPAVRHGGRGWHNKQPPTNHPQNPQILGQALRGSNPHALTRHPGACNGRRNVVQNLHYRATHTKRERSYKRRESTNRILLWSSLH
jgi:hypothetical protein